MCAAQVMYTKGKKNIPQDHNSILTAYISSLITFTCLKTKETVIFKKTASFVLQIHQPNITYPSFFNIPLGKMFNESITNLILKYVYIPYLYLVICKLIAILKLYLRFLHLTIKFELTRRNTCKQQWKLSP